MISLSKIKLIIKKSENPLIFFDDDPDGLCSYLQIKKYFNKGSGCVIKSSPTLDESYAKKVEEYSPDLVIILDKPILSQEFVDRVNVPIIWIDHHPPVVIKGVHYFNPLLKNEEPFPVSYWCYRLTKKFLWIGTVGSVADFSLVTMKKFNKKFPDLKSEYDDPAKILYNTKLGRLVDIFFSILKDPHYKVMQYVNLLEKIDSPDELLENTSKYSNEIINIYERMKRKYDAILEKAVSEMNGDSRVASFLYSAGRISFTPELSTNLLYMFPSKIIIVGRVTDGRVKMSLRSKNVKLPELINKSMDGLDGYGGGHDYACGGNISQSDFSEFKSRLETYLKN